jgi:hypothetical protein
MGFLLIYLWCQRAWIAQPVLCLVFGLGDWNLIHVRGKDLSFRHHVYTASEAHQICPSASFSGVKVAGAYS